MSAIFANTMRSFGNFVISDIPQFAQHTVKMVEGLKPFQQITNTTTRTFCTRIGVSVVALGTAYLAVRLLQTIVIVFRESLKTNGESKKPMNENNVQSENDDRILESIQLPQKNLETAQKELDEKTEEISALCKKNDELQAEFRALEKKQEETLNQLNEKNNAVVTTLTQELAKTSAELTRLQDISSEFLKEKEARIKKLEEDLESTKAAIQTLNDDSSQIENNSSPIRTENLINIDDLTKEKIINLEKILKNQLNELKKLKAENKSLSHELNIKNKELEIQRKDRTQKTEAFQINVEERKQKLVEKQRELEEKRAEHLKTQQLKENKGEKITQLEEVTISPKSPTQKALESFEKTKEQVKADQNDTNTSAV